MVSPIDLKNVKGVDEPPAVVTYQSLTNLHKELGFTMADFALLLGKDPSKKKGRKKPDAKQRKAAEERRILEGAFEEFDRHSRNHPPFGLSLPAEGESFTSIRAGVYGVIATDWLTPEETLELQRMFKGVPSYVIVQNIGALTHQKIAFTISRTFIAGMAAMQNSQRKAFKKDTSECNVHTRLPMNPLANAIVASGNSNRFMWDVLEVIPHVFENQFGRLPTPDEAEEIAKNSADFVEMFASCHFHVFLAMNDRLMQIQSRILRSPFFDPRWFRLRQRNGKLMLAVDDLVLQELPVLKKGSDVRTMCAALLAKKDGESLIEHVYRENVRIARPMLYDNVCLTEEN